jgi:hypothetical protein
MMQKKEHLLHYMMKGHVHLSKKDYGFFNNLSYIIKEKNQVTSNQNKLFDKLITKYQRQLRKCGNDIDILQKLVWDVSVVDSSQEYLVPRLYIEGNELCLRTPFNTNFVRSFKLAKDNTFVWNKDQRLYRSSFYTHALRLAYDSCNMFFGTLDMSDDIMELIAPLKQFENDTKAPILTTSQGKYYINNINTNLAEAIKDIELNDSPQTLYHLSRYGIIVDEVIIKEDPLKLFASQYVAKIDLDLMLTDKIDYIKKLGITDVYIPMKHASIIDKSIRTILQKEGITIHGNVDNIVDGTVIIKRVLGTDRINMLGVDPRKIGKVIHITNSRPVDIK